MSRVQSELQWRRADRLRAQHNRGGSKVAQLSKAETAVQKNPRLLPLLPPHHHVAAAAAAAAAAVVVVVVATISGSARPPHMPFGPAG